MILVRITLILALLSFGAWANESKKDSTQSYAEIERFEVATEADLSKTIHTLEERLIESHTQHPDLAPQLVVDESIVADDLNANAELTDSNQPSLAQKKQDVKNRRLIFTLARGTLGGAAAFWSLMILPQATTLKAAPIAASLGMFAAGLQWHSKKLSEFYAVPRTKFGRFFRWWYMEVLFLGLAKAGTQITHITDQTLTASLFALATTAAIGVATQGLWDVGTSEENIISLAQASSDRARVRIENLTSIKFLVASIFAIALNVAYLEHIPFASYALAVMGGAGAMRYIMIAKKRTECEHLFKQQSKNLLK